MCIISLTNPAVWSPLHPINRTATEHPSVRAVNEAGVIWNLDPRSYPELDHRFNPCSVSTSKTGDVFIADKGTDRVSKMADMSHVKGLTNRLKSRNINP